MNGIIEGGTINALMGPSGAGKTTLIKIIADKMACNSSTGAQGQVYVRHNFGKNEAKSFRIGYVPQDDQVFDGFTVRETFMFASKMTNGHLTSEEHDAAVDEVISKLDLKESGNTRINKLSGGQVKRTSIGVELMSSPQILILDEPTSGLDSDTSEKVISILRNLVQNPIGNNEPPAVLCTIHQPSRGVFYLFDCLFLLSRTGQNIYSGSPQHVREYLKSYGYVNDQTKNPAEYMIEVANGKHKTVPFDEMALETYRMTNSHICQKWKKSEDYNEVPISQLKMTTSTSFFSQVFLLFYRTFQMHTTRAFWTLSKTLCGIFLVFAIFNAAKRPFGNITGCWDSFQLLAQPESLINVTKGRSSLATLRNSNDNFNVNILGIYTSISEGSFNGFAMLMYQMLFYGVTLVFIFPMELKTHMKEMSNSWYSVSAFFIGRTLVNAFHLFIATLPMFTYVYWITNQPLDKWVRPVTGFAIAFIMGIISETKAEAFCLLLSSFPQTISMAVTVVSFFPGMFLAGVIVRYVDMVWFIKPWSRIIDLTHAIEANMIASFGLGRCSLTSNNSTDKLAAEDINVKRIAGSFWSTLKENKDSWSYILGQPEGYLNPITESITNLLETNNEEKGGGSFGDSFILDFYRIKESSLVYNVLNLMTTLIVCKLLVFILLKVKASLKLG
jgi:ABC-type multidrug transport system ATPase subunit